jgi:diaminopimelate epimerase
MSILKFTKMNGAGNDFIVIDTIFDTGNPNLSPKIIKRICDRRRGIGADGILLLEPSKRSDFQLRYFNSDGYKGSLCANGSRCAVMYYGMKSNTKKKNINFLFDKKKYSGEIIDENSVKFNLKKPKEDISKIDVNFNNSDIPVYFVDTGSPHAVILWDDIEECFTETFNKTDINTFGRKIRNSKEFAPSGTNVNIIMVKDGELFIRTYERGVENETYACGTGTVAASLVINRLQGYDSPIKFHTYGNDVLSVNFELKNGKFYEISLTGPVKINYIGSCKI